MDYKLTDDWFSHHIPIWQALELPDRKRFLEIGSWEGRSMIFTVESMMHDGGEMICVDTWAGSHEHAGRPMDLVEERFNHNQATLMEKYPYRRIRKVKGPSNKALQGISGGFDMVYIDGSHHGLDVMTDACNAWPLLKSGGMLIFDDYGWGRDLPAAQNPKLAIDTFLILLENSFDVILKSYQVILRKR